MNMTKEQYEVLRHTLGLNREDEPYRNHYADESDAKIPNELVDKGMMVKGDPHPMCGGLCFYQATNFGKEIAMKPFEQVSS
jgi:hypothetical protein